MELNVDENKLVMLLSDNEIKNLSIMKNIKKQKKELID